MPRLALNLFVLNGAQVLWRCLAPLVGVIDELVVVDCGSEDETRGVLESVAPELKLVRYYYTRLHPLGPRFFTDESASFDPPPGVSAFMPPPFSGRRICGDFSYARNLALNNTTADYVLKLDADDELVTPRENILRILDLLDASTEHDLVTAPYIVDGEDRKPAWASVQDRIWRRLSHLAWRQPIHEYLDGKTTENTYYVPSGLVVHDRRDSKGEGLRIPHRNLKVLLWNDFAGHFRYLPADSRLKVDFTIGHEAAAVMPAFARAKLASVMVRLATHSDEQMLADCHYHMGRAFQAEGDRGNALSQYLAADGTKAHLQALLSAYVLATPGEVKRKVALRVSEFMNSWRQPGAKTDARLTGVWNCDLVLLSRVMDEIHGGRHGERASS